MATEVLVKRCAPVGTSATRGALMRYDRLRRADARIVAGMTDGLNSLFSNDLAAAKVVRGSA